MTVCWTQAVVLGVKEPGVEGPWTAGPCDWNCPPATGLHVSAVPGSAGLTAPSPTPSFPGKKELLGSCPPGARQWTERALSASLAARQAWKELLMAGLGQTSPSSSIIQALSVSPELALPEASPGDSAGWAGSSGFDFPEKRVDLSKPFWRQDTWKSLVACVWV